MVILKLIIEKNNNNNNSDNSKKSNKKLFKSKSENLTKFKKCGKNNAIKIRSYFLISTTRKIFNNL